MPKPQQRKGRGRKPRREKPEFDQQIVDLARVTRVTKGGKQMSFRVCVLIGDRNGRVGYGLAKGKDVQIGVEKAVNQAKKTMVRIPTVNGTIPHRIEAKFNAARVLLKPAPQGSGIIAGSVVRTVLEMAGVPNASAKMVGKTNNKVNNVKAVFKAITSFKKSAVEEARKKSEAAKKNGSAKSVEKKDEKPASEKKKAAKEKVAATK